MSAKTTIGRANTRTIGWGDKSVTFEVVLFIDGGRGGSRWDAKRGDRHASIVLDVFTAEPSWKVAMTEHGETKITHHESLEASLLSAWERLVHQ